MAYIAPNSTIKLFSSVPLDNSYRNTLYFPSLNSQLQYFSGPLPGLLITLSNQYYQRISAGVCRVQADFSVVYKANYMAFKNDSFENKWFYAFVTDVIYLNNNVAEIHYEIDVMQSYLFDVELKPCLVEREHIPAQEDTIGANVLPEAFDTGEYRIKNIQPLINTNDYYIIVGMVDDETNPSTGILSSMDREGLFNAKMPKSAGSFYDRVYSGLQYYAFDASVAGAASVTAFINSHIKTIDNIYLMYMAPKVITPTPAADNSIPASAGSTQVTASATGMAGTEAFDGYTPINKKLYTYPYNYCGVTNGSGESMITRYEWFDSNTPGFRINTTFVHPVTLVCRPGNGYKGISNAQLAPATLYTESVTLTGFPLCSWSYDAYSRWAASRSAQIIRTGVVDTVESAAKTALTVAGAAMTGGALGASAAAISGMEKAAAASFGTNLISKAASIYEERYNASIAQDPAKGNLANGNADFGAGAFMFWTYRGHISGEVCKMIDQYFSMFGYKCNKVKIPNRSSRPIWNYTKTVSCVLEKVAGGIVNASEISQMEAIYDNGITWWTQPALVGDYTEANMAANHA